MENEQKKTPDKNSLEIIIFCETAFTSMINAILAFFFFAYKNAVKDGRCACTDVEGELHRLNYGTNENFSHIHSIFCRLAK